MLQKALRKARDPCPVLRFSEHMDGGDGAAMFCHACRMKVMLAFGDLLVSRCAERGLQITRDQLGEYVLDDVTAMVTEPHRWAQQWLAEFRELVGLALTLVQEKALSRPQSCKAFRKALRTALC